MKKLLIWKTGPLNLTKKRYMLYDCNYSDVCFLPFSLILITCIFNQPVRRLIYEKLEAGGFLFKYVYYCYVLFAVEV